MTSFTKLFSPFKIGSLDIKNRMVMSPMETQVREHQLQLRRRLESIKRIHKATDTLEDRIGELEHMERGILQQLGELDILRHQFARALNSTSYEKTALRA